MIKRDNLHYNTCAIDGYNAKFNFIISEREAGKSTAIWLDKAYKQFKLNGLTTLVVRRKVVHITTSYIQDISKIINKFTDDHVSFHFNVTDLKSGIVDVDIEGKHFLRIVALSIDITAIKSGVIENMGNIVFDEFICNPAYREKYLPNEASIFFDVYETFKRENPKLKCWFMGNPYSLYNPYFMFFNVATNKLKRGAMISDSIKSYVIECYEIKEELKQQILANDPLYQFDNSYMRFAFNGESINDQHIIVEEKRPNDFRLQFVFKIEGKYIACYHNDYFYNNDLWRYYCEFTTADKISKRRDIYAFDFGELVEGTILLSRDERDKFVKFKNAMRTRNIAFSNINVYYLVENIYYFI